jgi:hypothetical protein
MKRPTSEDRDRMRRVNEEGRAQAVRRGQLERKLEDSLGACGGLHRDDIHERRELLEVVRITRVER